ncbi:MAG: pyruvate carboxylase [Defluviicoccus sp.]|nr:pyruvate carboxylase [Defluviicoccus sp.]MDE0278061.1 pyruvate carboxylase [Defluviicoccus sp.]
MTGRPQTRFRRILVANRSEIAIRALRAAVELGIRTIAIYSQEDRFALHRFKADEAYLIGRGMGPIEAYLSIDEVLRVARENGADAIHPGYGFLSENPEFAEACADAGIAFVGPRPEIMRQLGNKVAAREIAQSAGVPVVPATGPLPRDADEAARLAREVGFPVMLKASWGGGGRGMREIGEESELADQVEAARRECLAAFGNDEVYLEKLIRRARHVEVQILGDGHGNLVHLHERDCSVQRRNQKIVERAPAHSLDPATRAAMHEDALKLGRAVGYDNAGTVEFLVDADTGAFYFIEVNPRIQVEHTVTEVVTGVDLVKAQIRIADGARIGTPESGVPPQDEIRVNGHALQCRVTTEDPENAFIPDYGVLTAYRGATGFGVRLDGGTAYSGARITPFYDSLLEKVTTWAPTPDEAIRRMDRALREFRIRGVATNLAFLENVIGHPEFLDGSYTTRFVDETPALFDFVERQDRATRLLRYVGEVVVNGNAAVEGRAEPPTRQAPAVPEVGLADIPDGSRQRLDSLGPEGFARWMLEQGRVLMTDTTFRDAHQSLLATRVRTHDLAAIAPAYARVLPGLLSVECWGGATFDVAMRFLDECPWDRLERLRSSMPNLLTQMLLRASNGVGYTTYPDNVVRYFVRQSAESGIDLFRIFDSLNWVENMRPAMDAVLETGRLCEAAICYTGDMTDPARPKYDLKYYVALARELEAAGAHILCIKDMAGLCKPAAARTLVAELKREIGIPIHFHTHDTSGISAASVLAAVEAGVDAVDAAMDSMSGLTSQPSFGSIVAALRHSERDPGIDPDTVMMLSTYWEQVRNGYRAFESDFRAGTSDVYNHEIPGGQYTNLREQARALGIDDQRWPEVSRTYAEVNRMFGDIVKVTPSSKVVGDMALMMVTSGLTPDDVANPDREIAFPESVVSLFAGELGQPHGGFPRALQEKILKGREPITVRPGSAMPDADLDADRKEAEKAAARAISDAEFASWLMYPQVFGEYAARQRDYGDVSVLPTPVYFYGMEPGEEIAVDIERGRTLIVRYLARSEPDRKGECTVFFELNGQPRTVRVADRSAAAAGAALPKAEEGNAGHVGAPMPGMVVKMFFNEGEAVEEGDVVAAIEAMKMETVIRAGRGGVVSQIVAPAGTTVETKDLLVVVGDG